MDCLCEHQGVGQIINIFARAAEMHILFVPAYILLHEILHRFQIMIGCLFDLLYACSRLVVEIRI
jgi:hypothetical protein